jgi:hypothetical protein
MASQELSQLVGVVNRKFIITSKGTRDTIAINNDGFPMLRKIRFAMFFFFFLFLKPQHFENRIEMWGENGSDSPYHFPFHHAGGSRIVIPIITKIVDNNKWIFFFLKKEWKCRQYSSIYSVPYAVQQSNAHGIKVGSASARLNHPPFFRTSPLKS